MKKHTKIYVGIDLHKVNQTWVGLPEVGSEKLFCREFPVIPQGVAEAVSFAQKHNDTIVAVIEPCCGWMWVKQQLETLGVEVHVTNPRKVRAIADSLQKTDENDAYTLALLLRTGMINESRELPDETKELRSLVRERSFFEGNRDSHNCFVNCVV